MTAEQLQKLVANPEAELWDEPVSGSAVLRPLPPESWPVAWRARLHEEAEAQGGIIAVWLSTTEESSAPLPAGTLHLTVWVRDAEHTTTGNLRRAAEVAFPERHLEWLIIDEAQHAEAVAAMRAFPPVWPPASGAAL